MIRTESVTKRHGDVLAVDSVDLEIGDGLTAVIGPNGAGKSTLLSLIARLLPRDEGTVLVDDLDVFESRSREVARRLAVLRQENHLPIRLSVDDLVRFGRFPHGRGRTPQDHAAVDAAIASLDLGGLRGRYLDELSGGQRQRAFVAMALAQETQWLLLDEPLNNLDPRHAVSLMKLLRSLVAERGLGVVVVMHDINTAAQFADRVVAMRAGRVVAHGDVAEVMTAERLAEIYETPARVEVVDGRRVVLWQ